MASVRKDIVVGKGYIEGGLLRGEAPREIAISKAGAVDPPKIAEPIHIPRAFIVWSWITSSRLLSNPKDCGDNKAAPSSWILSFDQWTTLLNDARNRRDFKWIS